MRYFVFRLPFFRLESENLDFCSPRMDKKHLNGVSGTHLTLIFTHFKRKSLTTILSRLINPNTVDIDFLCNFES